MTNERCEDTLERLMEIITEGVYFLDESGRITYWNNGAERITGYSREEALGKKCSDNFLRHVDEMGRELCIDGCPMMATMYDCRPREAEIFLHHKDGHRVPINVRTSPITGKGQKAVGVVEVFSDRSERSSLIVELENLRKEVLTDPLTGLGNRRYAEICAAAALRDLEAEGTEFGVLMLDIDRFKSVNDNFGHAIGDRALRMVGWTLANSLRRSDAAARWGGEEFLAVCPRIRRPLLEEVAERARALIERSWISLDDGRKIAVTVSVGGAIALRGEALEALVARADERLYACKTAGRNRVAIAV
jgi:diguanylate cyclase (GGDEF)-like protein/PAS domain S-box-containing protein